MGACIWRGAGEPAPRYGGVSPRAIRFFFDTRIEYCPRKRLFENLNSPVKNTDKQYFRPRKVIYSVHQTKNVHLRLSPVRFLTYDTVSKGSLLTFSVIRLKSLSPFHPQILRQITGLYTTTDRQTGWCSGYKNISFFVSWSLAGYFSQDYRYLLSKGLNPCNSCKK